MRVIITTIPGFGHICPMLPLALALIENGHQVALATSNSMRSYIEPLGIELLSCGPDWLESEFSHDRIKKELVDAPRYGLTSFVEKDVFPNTFSSLLSHVSIWRPDVIMSNDYEMSGRIIAEILQIPFVLLSHGPRLSRESRNRWHAPIAKKARIHAGLDPSNALDYALHWLHLNFTPDWYVLKGGGDYSPAENEYGIQPGVYDSFPNWCSEVPPQLDSSTKKPKVLCTLGTVFNKDSSLLSTILGATADSVESIHVTEGMYLDGSVNLKLPENVRFLKPNPLSRIISQFDYCICHGGTSTFMTALMNGIPCLLLPQGADQEINGILCNQFDLGVALFNWNSADTGGAITSNSKYRDTITDGFQKLLASSDIIGNCVNFRDSCQNLPDLDKAVDLIKTLVSTGESVLL